jgi:hypothetical protein
MNQLLRFAALGVGCCSALFFGCGGGEESGPATSDTNFTDPVKLCEEIVKIECQKIYACAKDAPALIEIAMLPPTEADCNHDIKAALNCAGATADKVCAGDQTYTLAKGNTCLAQAKQAQCTQILASGREVWRYAPDCGQCAPL